MSARELVPVPGFGPFDAVAAAQHQASTASDLTEAVDAHRASTGWVLAAGDVLTDGDAAVLAAADAALLAAERAGRDRVVSAC